jgi:hypothetical protein
LPALLADDALPDAAGTGELVLEAADPSLAESPEYPEKPES